MRHLLACLAILAAFNSHSQVWNANADVDQDGCVGVGDVLDILSVFGSCEPPWQCGDNLEYAGYSYETVQVGEQCWFAENLRTQLYRNGETIAGNLNNGDWQSTIEGAQAVYDSDPLNIDLWGRLYNFHAVVDDRNICPVQWKVPSDLDWQVLESALGMDDSELLELGYWRGQVQEVGNKLKSSQFDFYPWDGLNAVGFNGVPSGIRNAQGFYANETGSNAWWSLDLFGPTAAFYRALTSINSGVMRFNAPLNTGASVRCLKDTE